MRIIFLALFAALAGCAAWNDPLNKPLTSSANATLTEPDAVSIDDGELYVGLAFSGGGMRASAFAYGMAEELRSAGVSKRSPNGLLDHVRLVSGVSGGSVTAAQLGLWGPEGLNGYREKYLLTNAQMTHLWSQ